MPMRIPTYNDGVPSVAPSAMPQPRFTPAKMGDAGAQTREFAQGIGQLGQGIGSIGQDIQRRFDQTRLDDAGTKAAKAKTALLTELYQLQGKNALERDEPLAEEFARRYKEQLDEISGQLGNKAQREAFARFVKNELQSLSEDANSWMVKQQAVYEDEQYKGLAETAYQNAGLLWGDEKAVQENSDAVRVATLRQIQKEGLDKEAAELAMVEAMSPLHSAVISGMLDGNQLELARNYYNNHSAEMTLQERARAQNAFARGAVADQSLRNFLAYQQSGATLKAATSDLNQRFLAGDITAEVRDATIVRLQQGEKANTESRAELRTQLTGQYQTALANDLTATPYDLPATLQLQLQQEGLWDDAINFAKNGRFITDKDAWIDFLNMPASELASMSDAEYQAKYRSKLDNSDFDKGLKILNDAKNVGGTLSMATRIKNGAYVAIGKNPGAKLDDKDKQRLAAMEQNISNRVASRRASKPVGSELTDEELNAVISESQRDVVKQSRWYWSDKIRPVGALLPDELKKAEVTVGGKDVKISSIPEAKRREANTMLGLAGYPITEENIVRVSQIGLPPSEAVEAAKQQLINNGLPPTDQNVYQLWLNSKGLQ